MKIPFTGSTPVNATDELIKENSETPDMISSTEALKENKETGTTTEPQQMEKLAPKIEEVSIGTVATTVTPNAVPDALVYKYNRYCDRIYERIGAILKQSYDPVNVRLSTSITHKTVKKTTTQKKKKKRYVSNPRTVFLTK